MNSQLISVRKTIIISVSTSFADCSLQPLGISTRFSEPTPSVQLPITRTHTHTLAQHVSVLYPNISATPFPAAEDLNLLNPLHVLWLLFCCSPSSALSRSIWSLEPSPFCVPGRGELSKRKSDGRSRNEYQSLDRRDWGDGSGDERALSLAARCKSRCFF